jgi:hypothetical protein
LCATEAPPSLRGTTTVKCEHLYDADTAEMTPEEGESMIDRFIADYNNEAAPGDRLRNAGRAPRRRHAAIIEARKRGMQEAKLQRRMEAYGGSSGGADG